jgi:hypothetical protein
VLHKFTPRQDISIESKGLGKFLLKKAFKSIPKNTFIDLDSSAKKTNYKLYHSLHNIINVDKNTTKEFSESKGFKIFKFRQI